ncbi:MAG: choice-of-anchor E domain-containing protein [Phycisphaerales bacterium JB059]
MRSLRSVIACATLAALALPAVGADSLSYTDTIDFQAFGAIPDFTIESFDSARGQLESIEVSLAIDWMGQIVIENTSPLESATLLPHSRLEYELSVQWPDAAPIATFTGVFNPDALTLDPFDGVSDFAGASGATLSEHRTFTASTTLATESMSAFIDTGEQLFAFSAVQVALLSAQGGDVTLTSHAFAGGSLTVTYNYVPTPGTLALITAAPLAMRRRR